MKYYPVFIPTLNRFTHFRNCVESLSCCTHANKTELVIGLDYPPSEKYEEGYRKIKKYIPTISGFAKVTVFEHDKNLGPGGNWQYLVEYCRLHYDAYIGTEDDNVFAPAFLDYMDKALELFWDDEKISTVSGYNCEAAYNQKDYTCYPSKDTSAWGIGCWVHKEKFLNDIISNELFFKKVLCSAKKANIIIKTFPINYYLLNCMVKNHTSYGDVKRTVINILYNRYQLRPAISLVRNNGFDGSGIHCHSENPAYGSQIISEEKFFDFTKGHTPFNDQENSLLLYLHGLSTNIIVREEQLKEIKYLYMCNTNIFYIIRKKIALKNKLNNFCKIIFSK